MAIVDTMDPDVASASYSAGDFYPLTKWQTAGLALDIGLMFTPLAIFSGIRKATYIRKGIQTYKAAKAGRGVAAVEAYMVSRPIRTSLFLGGSAAGFAVSPLSPVYPHIMLAQGVGDQLIAIYIDREGRISSFLPTDEFVHDYIESSGEDSYLAIRTGTSADWSFYNGNGLAALKSMRGSTPPLPKWTLSSKSSSGQSRTRRLRRGRTQASGERSGRSRTRSRPWWFSTKAKRRISRKRS